MSRSTRNSSKDSSRRISRRLASREESAQNNGRVDNTSEKRKAGRGASSSPSNSAAARSAKKQKKPPAAATAKTRSSTSNDVSDASNQDDTDTSHKGLSKNSNRTASKKGEKQKSSKTAGASTASRSPHAAASSTSRSGIPPIIEATISSPRMQQTTTESTLSDALNTSHQSCSSTTVKVRPDAIVYFLPNYIDKDRNLVLANTNSNHNVPDEKTALEITNNIMNNPMRSKVEYECSCGHDMIGMLIHRGTVCFIKCLQLAYIV